MDREHSRWTSCDTFSWWYSFGLSGLYAVIKHHRRLLYTHTVVSWTVFILRGFTWTLSMLHEYKLNPWIMSIGLLELVLALLSTVLLRDALIYF
uniref:Uncharacterized protein n=1 Tax=Sarcoptes scabiei TaxID=52283 RepID=A0A834RI65_SARSC